MNTIVIVFQNEAATNVHCAAEKYHQCLGKFVCIEELYQYNNNSR